jgi:hypothetical protein
MNAFYLARVAAIFASLAIPVHSHAWFFVLPIPNMSKPAPLNSLIDALEKSEETKAVAFVSEDKTFGQKYWVWGHFSGHIPQGEADRVAMSRCLASLANAKNQNAGGKPLYDYGTKTCELYSFANKTVSPRAGEWQSVPTTTMPPVQATPQTNRSTAPTIAASAPASLPTSSEAAATQASSASAPSPTEARPPSQPQAPQPNASESATAKKLWELEALRKEGLISEAEYQEKRKAILAAM